jgi:hydroxymethylpyrimidine pyrophosphatase-like HAD family hydrolase
VTADEAMDAMPGNPQEELRLELGEARKALHAVRADGLDAFVIDAGRGEELLRGAARVMKELRLELGEARETLDTIRAGGFDALVIDAGRGEEVFALGGTGRPDQLLVGARADGGAGYFRTVALDFDGTLAEGQVAPATLAALTEARARGVRVILVTGRIMSELRAVFPEVDDHIDAVVAENGALLVTHGGVRLLAAPIGRAVSAALTGRGVAHRSGQVLIAGAAADEPAVLEVVRELGLDCRLVRNRGELMVLPAGVTKGTGLLEALGELGLSPHNAIGVGDGENDHSLLDACEVGVAVANAVDALRAHADMSMSLPDGQGVADLLLGPLVAGRVHLYPRRWQVTLGTDDRGERVTLPGSQLNIAICGGTGKGKSYLAGLICEQLIRLGYSLVVFDPEGDHHGLGELRDVIITGGHEGRLADPAEVVRLLRHSHTSVVTDLSHLDAAARAAYVTDLASAVEAHRAATGVPQWVVVDEAHVPIGRTVTARRMLNPPAKGYLLVTWQPLELSADALLALDAVITLGSARPDSQFIDITAAVADMPRAEIARRLTGPGGRAVLAWRQRPGRAVAFTLGPRTTPHLRHAHKYGQAGVEPARRFYFKTGPDTATGAVAANLDELEAELGRCDQGVLRHHCPRHEFSGWVAGVFRDEALAADLAELEAALPADSHAAVVEQVRLALIALLQTRAS